MAESDGGEASPSGGGGGEGSPDPRRPPARPQLTKSRTISGSAASAFDRWGTSNSSSSILVRRSSTAPLPPGAAPRGCSPWPWTSPPTRRPTAGRHARPRLVLPSFLGPHASRPRPPRSQQQTPTTTAAAAADSRSPTPAAPPQTASVSQREEEKSLASVVKRPMLLDERRSLSPPPPQQRAPRFDLSPYLVLVSEASCCAIYVWSLKR